MAKQRYKSQREHELRQQRIVNCGKVDARGEGVKNTRNYGVLADRVYGPAMRCRTGVVHFHT